MGTNSGNASTTSAVQWKCIIISALCCFIAIVCWIRRYRDVRDKTLIPLPSSCRTDFCAQQCWLGHSYAIFLSYQTRLGHSVEWVFIVWTKGWKQITFQPVEPPGQVSRVVDRRLRGLDGVTKSWQWLSVCPTVYISEISPIAKGQSLWDSLAALAYLFNVHLILTTQCSITLL